MERLGLALALIVAGCSAPTPTPRAECRTTILFTSATGDAPSGPASWGGGIAVDGDQVYFTGFSWPTTSRADELHGVFAVPDAGGDARSVGVFAPSGLLGEGLVIVDGTLHWSGEPSTDFTTPNAVFSAPIGGGDVTTQIAFPDSQAAYANVAVDDPSSPHTIYFGSYHAIVSLDLATQTVATVHAGDVGWIDTNRGVLYAILTGPTNSLVRFDGTTPTTLATLGGDVVHFVTNDAGAYVVQREVAFQIPFDGTPKREIARAKGLLAVVAASERFLYAQTSGGILRAALDGTDARLIPGPQAIGAAYVLHGQALYWSSLASVGRIDGCIE